ncbi:WapI family immunity protein [Paenibacillus sp. strain BS8-2]
MNVRILGEENQKIIISFEEVSGFPNSTSYSGGYDFEGTIQIRSGNYTVQGSIWLTTGELFQLNKEISEMYKQLKGKAFLKAFDSDFEVTIEIDQRGRIYINGNYKEFPSVDNELTFSFESDQSYLVKTIEDLQLIYLKYGGMKGIKDL